jgi:hypothetical protein
MCQPRRPLSRNSFSASGLAGVLDLFMPLFADGAISNDEHEQPIWSLAAVLYASYYAGQGEHFSAAD